MTMQCVDTFRGFLHKIYAATMDGKGREGTYNFFHDDWRGSWGQGIGHRVQLPPATPLAPPMDRIEARLSPPRSFPVSFSAF